MTNVQLHPHPTNPEPGQGACPPRPVHMMLSEAHLAEAGVNRREAANLIRVRDDMKFHPETDELKMQVSAALLALADARERLVVSLAGGEVPRTTH